MPVTKKARPKLDRFAALKAMFADITRVRDTAADDGVRGGPSTALAYCALWTQCDGRTGSVVMPVARLARLIGSTRHTARRALAILETLKYIAPVEKDGAAVPGKWIVDHSLIEEND